ncbi:hypothetical protein TWF569_008126 [Orbilia oligospora]|uniref:Uncharacterized protein n=1 Tax=Orbilia oligospora TaxID=2813651 RepID=A0A7C8NEA8_ORBOL|nr:hypothetical protein TWF102_002144 [Orbilia oligospora]KAF3081374.1 hypothetical protein TWF103_003754 [Orbilia oligospora]KAF3081388.1 hypothetical protein TWF706_002286 [Orbilia oligospora]KAF3141248.1 hypothetical protein TWF569_008126 [Orbilia oligospora]KAF3148910.1 hypothetical protein TWF594_000365 [Orbilia oligospora]
MPKNTRFEILLIDPNILGENTTTIDKYKLPPGLGTASFSIFPASVTRDLLPKHWLDKAASLMSRYYPFSFFSGCGRGSRKEIECLYVQLKGSKFRQLFDNVIAIV